MISSIHDHGGEFGVRLSWRFILSETLLGTGRMECIEIRFPTREAKRKRSYPTCLWTSCPPPLASLPAPLRWQEVLNPEQEVLGTHPMLPWSPQLLKRPKRTSLPKTWREGEGDPQMSDTHSSFCLPVTSVPTDAIQLQCTEIIP